MLAFGSENRGRRALEISRKIREIKEIKEFGASAYNAIPKLFNPPNLPNHSNVRPELLVYILE